jgi:hypothetical protein
MAPSPSRDGLHVIFSIFLGLMVAAFVGIGVYTFYEPPGEDPRMEVLQERENDIRIGSRGAELPPEAEAELREIQQERNVVWEEQRRARSVWARNTSIILILLATVAMAISLVRADQLPVISNGLLLGGVFTMLYGVGWIIASDNATSRFVVITIALAVTIGLGYVRFVKRRDGGAASVRPTESTDVSDLEGRVAALEVRLNDAARALEDRR